MENNNINNKLKIKSAGFINGEYKVILENDIEIDGIRFIKVEKDVNSAGLIYLEAYTLDKNNLKK